MQKKVLILGGYGNAGFLIAKILLKESNIQIVLAGRNLIRAGQAADKLNGEFRTNQVSIKEVNAADTKSLEAAFKGVDIVVVASSTIDYTRNVAETALRAGADYLDVQLSSPAKLAALNSLRKAIEEKGRCFITDGGFHPGVPAAMVRYVMTKFDKLQAADISSAFRLNWKELQFSESTINEFIDELRNFNPLVFKDKKWVKLSLKEIPKFDFGKHFGKRYCSPMYLEELRSLPGTIPSLNDAGFYIAGFNRVTDYIIMPVAFIAFKMFRERARKPAGKLFNWGLRNFSNPPYGAILQLEAKGLKNGKNILVHMKLIHEDAYILTAVPIVACLLQYIEGSIRCPGLWFQANLVEPIKFFKDIERLGVQFSIQIK